MPAVHLPRLKEQIARLALYFSQPEDFLQRLHELFDLYADRAYRPGQAVRPRPLVQTYHAPPLVLRMLEQELGKQVNDDPDAALDVAGLLWQDAYLEPRLLAAALLGQVPVNPPEPVLERLLAWADPDVDPQILETLMLQGSNRLRREQPERWLALVEHWLESSSKDIQGVGLKSLLPLVQDRSFQNLPRIYRILHPLVQSAPGEFLGDLQKNIEVLARRSPAETAYFLRQMLSLSESSGTVRLVRRVLPAFAEEQQASLRKALLARQGER
jgi:hypothetical protein